MLSKKNAKKLIYVVLAAMWLCGCGEMETAVSTDFFVHETVEKESMLSAPEIDYEVPASFPGILVNLRGYETSEEKTAILVGDTIPAAFEVKDANSDETVFRGYVKRKNVSAEDGLGTAIADFSTVDLEGTYYISADILGKSKKFEIKSGLYETEILDAFSRLKELHCDYCHTGNVPFESNQDVFIDVTGGWHTSMDGEKDVVEACLSVLDLCTAFEYYPKAFKDDWGSSGNEDGIPDIVDEIKYEAQWLLKMQNPETGGVYTKVYLCDVSGRDAKRLMVDGETTRATAYFCACLSKVSLVIKKYDAAFAQSAIQAAALSWSALEANKDIVDLEQMYRAAVEMYRATGSDTYKNVINQYLEANAEKEYEGRLQLDGAITYLATPRATNVEFCTALMSNFMSRTDSKAEMAEKNRYAIESEELSVDELLRNTYELLVVDYIISSNAYVPLEKNYYNYLSGRNFYSYDYIKDIEAPDALAKYLALLCRLTSDVSF